MTPETRGRPWPREREGPATCGGRDERSEGFRGTCHLLPLDDTLLQHGGGHLHEAGYVGALHVVHGTVRLLSELNALRVDGSHDEVKPFVNLLCTPAYMGSVLSHFKAGSGDAAGVHSLSRGEHHAVVLEIVDCSGLAAHVR